MTRARLAAAVADGTDWLDAAIAQLNLSRSALESLSTANPVLVARVMGVSRPGPKVREPWRIRTRRLRFPHSVITHSGSTASRLRSCVAGVVPASSDTAGGSLRLETSIVGVCS